MCTALRALALTSLALRSYEIAVAGGGVIAGTSAGASVMNETMLVRGPKAAPFRMGDLCMAPGLGLLPNVIIDQHLPSVLALAG
ncbi:hypothetical protein [Sinorhizobium meliloti]|uniref:hypothetical protein n=1 Tax=Rhizobium meliloti TaxID=382 RepID=UPI002090B4E8|nr:hypothetical protein [Sinorhizobium meliloti]MCO5963685.1 hypothetical protein [Sinorhizobium meliloti]